MFGTQFSRRTHNPQPTTHDSVKAKPGSAWARIGGQPEPQQPQQPQQQVAEAATAPAAEEAAAAIEKVKLEETPAPAEAVEAPVAAPAPAPAAAAAAEQAGEEPVVAGEPMGFGFRCAGFCGYVSVGY